MKTSIFAKSVVVQTALDWHRVLGYGILHGSGIAGGMLGAERGEPNCRDAVLESRLPKVPVLFNLDRPPAAMHGTLFPKLISGDFRLKDAEHIVGIA